MFDDEDWVYTPGAYIAYPQYDYKPTERREDFAFQSQLGYKRRSAATARRSNHGRVGWNSSLKAPYRPLGTPRFDITARPKPPVEDARLQIKHPSRGKQRDAGERESDAHKNLEPGKEVMGKVSQFKFQYYMIYVPSGRILTVQLTALTGDPDMFIDNTNQYPTGKESLWKSAEVGEDKVTITPDAPGARPGMYYIGVYGPKDSRFSILASLTTPARKMPVVQEPTLNGYGLIRQELERAQARKLAAKQGNPLEWDLPHFAQAAAMRPASLGSAGLAAAREAVGAADGEGRGGEGGGEGGEGVDPRPGSKASTRGEGGEGSVGSRPSTVDARAVLAAAAAAAEGGDARGAALGAASPFARRRSSARDGDSMQRRSPPSAPLRVLPVPALSDVALAAERAAIGQVERTLLRSRQAAIIGASRPKTTGLTGGVGRGGGGPAAGSFGRGRAVTANNSPTGEDVRKIAPARFYARSVSPGGTHYGPGGGAGGDGGAGSAPPTADGNDARTRAGAALARARSSGSGAGGGGADKAHSPREEVPLEHRLASQRSEYARLKAEYNRKLVHSLERMEAERALNHRLRQGAFSRVDPTAHGLQGDVILRMMRTDAYALKLELERVRKERAHEMGEATTWDEKLGRGALARSRLDAIAKIGQGTSLVQSAVNKSRRGSAVAAP